MVAPYLYVGGVSPVHLPQRLSYAGAVFHGYRDAEPVGDSHGLSQPVAHVDADPISLSLSLSYAAGYSDTPAVSHADLPAPAR